ncbi:MAG: glutamine synthetase III [Bacteroidales bacterium]|nr:glutamine synthetase III [Bacteroidales bacterium]
MTATSRFKALEREYGHKPVHVDHSVDKDIKFYACNVFDRTKMAKYLPETIYKKVVQTIDEGKQIDRDLADHVANAMKQWALQLGVTHYTHWFQPLTDQSAEKHDSFFTLDNGSPVEAFDGKVLAQQEPDASSFPSGGIRNTFEARGYTAWDCTSPAFVIGSTLCIPTIFISYTGEALDYKTPLLRSLNAIDRTATSVCRYFLPDTKHVINTLGWEQEYFLIDEALFDARPDLVACGRTLMGHNSAKNQQLDDHYFGSIPERVVEFMADLEVECHKLGIPVRTRHNEVAPGQYECAPIFEETNLAVDHNMLLMDLMMKIARRHNFRILLHEKPFASVNGSGKHNNWSLAADGRINLLSPGKDHNSNLMFLTFLVNVIKSVYDYSDLLRASIMTAGNEHRLGASEAPPAIISVFLGTHLSNTLQLLKEKTADGKILDAAAKKSINLNLEQIPDILLDNTDRNRTSPFAFTGNRFEFRAVGSSANCACPLIVLNTIVASQLEKFKNEVDLSLNNGSNKEEAILTILGNYVSDFSSILFEGNNYSEEWKQEAKKRGLSNVLACPDSIEAYTLKSTIDLFESQKVLSERELRARQDIYAENYHKKIQIESRVLANLALNHIVPTAIRYQNLLIENYRNSKGLGFDELIENRLDTIKFISKIILEIKEGVSKMTQNRKDANSITDNILKAKTYHDNVKPYLSSIRANIDQLELIVEDEMWPLPKYREMLFCH